MRAGPLRHEITFQRRTASQDPGGQVVDTYVDAFSEYAALEDLSGREYAASSQVQAELTTRIRIRWRPDVDETFRIRHVVDQDASPPIVDLYDIVAPPLTDAKTGRRELVLMCLKRRADGYRRGND